MKKYISPFIEITTFHTQDIITDSGVTNAVFDEVQGEAPSGVSFNDVWPQNFLD